MHSTVVAQVMGYVDAMASMLTPWAQNSSTRAKRSTPTFASTISAGCSECPSPRIASACTSKMEYRK